MEFVVKIKELGGVLVSLWVFEIFGSEEADMLWTLFSVLLVLWLFGMVTNYTMNGLIHILLVAALVVLLIRIISGGRTTI